MLGREEKEEEMRDCREENREEEKAESACAETGGGERGAEKWTKGYKSQESVQD